MVGHMCLESLVFLGVIPGMLICGFLAGSCLLGSAVLKMFFIMLGGIRLPGYPLKSRGRRPRRS